ncbi:DUF943 family protein [Erwinia sp. PsM31]|uniref:DUF943 family protein n=1 Tax=Erwinia sp. PsM31 TaxID=3030535 RepID=UPI00263BCA99|nr:DUF943 family protein [Erwinia sp. PsM31]MDN4626658.1 DUF943 family protein [Erwinia sp. PsM31]
MKTNKKLLSTLLLVGSVSLVYVFWLFFRPVVIVAVHEDGNFSDVIVKNVPFTDRGKIAWWLKNKDKLKNRYGIPKPALYGNYTISFWLFGDDYKEESKYDRLCFKDMQTDKNCIDKNRVFSIDKSKNKGTIFVVYDGDDYRLEENGEVIKIDHN